MRLVEIKARIPNLQDFNCMRAKAEWLNKQIQEDSGIHQDHFFQCTSHNRLQLRIYEDGTSDLIRSSLAPDHTNSSYEKTSILGGVETTKKMENILTNALGLKKIVRKTRYAFMIGKNRLKLDEVDNLGFFAKISAELEDDEKIVDGVLRITSLANDLRLTEFILKSYVDMFTTKHETYQESPLNKDSSKSFYFIFKVNEMKINAKNSITGENLMIALDGKQSKDFFTNPSETISSLPEIKLLFPHRPFASIYCSSLGCWQTNCLLH